MNKSKNFNKRLKIYLKKREAIIERAKSWDNEKQQAHQHMLSIMGRPTLVELVDITNNKGD